MIVVIHVGKKDYEVVHVETILDCMVAKNNADN